MSFLIIEINSKGLIFGADKNVTTTNLLDGSTHQNTKTEKVLKWNNEKALVGFVGQGRIGNLTTKEWLENFITNNPNFTSLKEISSKLKDEVEKQTRIDNGINKPEPLIIHLGGFEKSANGISSPEVYLITNVWGLGAKGYEDFRSEFKSTEELWKNFPDITNPSDLNKAITQLEYQLEPFWFHQGLDLITFNVLHESLKLAFKSLINDHPDHKLPKTLEEWEKHSKLQILMYGSYFESFNTPDKLFVGGGADILSLEWK